MAATLGSIIAYLISIWNIRRNIVKYQILILTIFLVHIMIEGELDHTFPIYLVAAILPYLSELKFRSPFVIAVVVFHLIYLFAGIFMQDIRASLVSLTTKIFPLILFLLFTGYQTSCSKASLLCTVRIAVMVETALGVYLTLEGTSIQSNGLTRLVSNAQPVVGNISVAILPIIIWLYFNLASEPRKQTQLLIYSFILFIWVTLSGTRGYMMMFALPFSIILTDYFLNTKNRDYDTARRRLLFLMICTFIITPVIALFAGRIADMLVGLFRLSDSLGVRGAENRLCFLFFKEAPWYIKLFGIGIGGTGADYGAYRVAVSEVMGSSWTYARYTGGSGAIFHNYYANILLMQGIVGMAFLFATLLFAARYIAKCRHQNEHLLRLCLVICLFGFAAMNWFRWSAACGLPELLMTAIAAGLQNKNGKTV